MRSIASSSLQMLHSIVSIYVSTGKRKSLIDQSQCHYPDISSLRRLPLSGSIVFNFKAIFTPISEFRDEPMIPSLVLEALKEGKESLMKYKNTWQVEHVALPALEQYEREQKANGMMAEDWDVQTLDESPFFPGWAEKWHRQQGF